MVDYLQGSASSAEFLLPPKGLDSTSKSQTLHNRRNELSSDCEKLEVKTTPNICPFRFLVSDMQATDALSVADSCTIINNHFISKECPANEAGPPCSGQVSEQRSATIWIGLFACIPINSGAGLRS